MIELDFATDLEKYASLNLSDVVVLPSARETKPLVFLEAWSFKKCVIGADIPTVRSVIASPGDRGYLVKYGDVKGLGNAIKMLTQDKELARSAAERESKKLEQYNLLSVGRKLLHVYRQLLERDR